MGVFRGSHVSYTPSITLQRRLSKVADGVSGVDDPHENEKVKTVCILKTVFTIVSHLPISALKPLGLRQSMSAVAERILRVLEELANSPEGMTLSELTAVLDLPITAIHRLLADLIEQDYVRKDERRGEFTLTMKLPSLGLRFLSAGGVVDIAQPILERLAVISGELVRLAVVDGEQLVYVAKAQGAREGLRYDPEMGRPVTLSCSAAGISWLAGKSDEEVMRLVAAQGFGLPANFGPSAPTTFKTLLPLIETARKNGYATTQDMFLPAMSSLATTVTTGNGDVGALLIIAGPMSRLTHERMKELLPALMSTAAELSEASSVSPVMRRASI